jgi:hypothetical protein
MEMPHDVPVNDRDFLAAGERQDRHESQSDQDSFRRRRYTCAPHGKGVEDTGKRVMGNWKFAESGIPLSRDDAV